MKGMPTCCPALRESLWESERGMRTGHTHAHQKKCLPGLERDWNRSRVHIQGGFLGHEWT